jgi:hypothetical protein
MFREAGKIGQIAGPAPALVNVPRFVLEVSESRMGQPTGRKPRLTPGPALLVLATALLAAPMFEANEPTSALRLLSENSGSMRSSPLTCHVLLSGRSEAAP